MKTLVIGTGSGASTEAIMAVYPCHKAVPSGPSTL